jgi:hypothetical protein
MPSAQLFPHHSSTAPPPNYYSVRAAYIKYFNDRVREGTVRPLIPHYHLAGMLLLLGYLCIPHTTRPWLYKARWGVLAWITWWSWKTAWETSSQSAGVSLVTSLVSAWGWVMSCLWLVLRRPQFDAKRVQRRPKRAASTVADVLNGKPIPNRDPASGAEVSEQDGMFHGNTSHASDEKSTTKRRSQNANPTLGSSASDQSDEQVRAQKAVPTEEYFWQPYPDTFKQRFEWVTDLLVNFRGPGWNWAISTLPSPPLAITNQVGEFDKASARTGRSRTGLQRFDTRKEVFNFYVPRFLAHYFLTDFIKTVMMQDPYFLFGPTTYALPPFLASLSPTSLLIFREVLSAGGIIIIISMAFQLAPLCCVLLLGPGVLGQRGEPWYYATSWGSFSNILEKGLAGLWGGWWHQTFRFCFSAPTLFLIENNYISAHSKYKAPISGFFAFGISGLLHSAGSVSQIAHTKPLNNMVFFLLQAFGIFLQTTLCSLFRRQIKALPKPVRQAGNVVFCFSWLLSTGWLLTDDFARGGVWLVEPIPISLLRGLGFGVEGDRWWTWKDMGSGWYSGQHFYESGFAFF